MKRLAKKFLSRSLPSRLKSWMKRRELAKTLGSVPGSARVSPEDGVAVCEFAPGRHFSMSADYLDDLREFTTDTHLRAEFFGIANRAAEADGGILFDVGAHAGTISLLFCSAHPKNRSFAFEPSPVLLKRLDESVELNGLGGRLCVQRVAIGEKAGKLTMLIDPVGGYVQSQRFAHSMWAEPEKVEVPVESLGSAAARLGVDPTHVKIDIEGYEFELVRGARDYLALHRPVLFFELHLNYLEERGLRPADVIRTLADIGYRFETYGGRPLRESALVDCPLASVRFVAKPV